MADPITETRLPPIGGLGRHMAWVYVELAAQGATGLGVTAVALHRLGAAEFGVFSLILAVSSFALVLDLGLGFTVVRAAAREMSAGPEAQRAEARSELERAHSAYVGLGVVALVATGAFVVASPAVLPASPSGRLAVAVTAGLVGLRLAVSLATSAMTGVVTGRNGFRVLALATTAGCAVQVATILLLVGRFGLVALGIGAATSMLVERLLVGWWMRRHVRWLRLRPRRLTGVEVRRTIHVAFPLLLLAIGSQVIATTDLVILGWLASSAVVGLYSLGSTLPTQAVAVLYRGYDVVLPSFSGTDDRAAQEAALRFLTKVVSYVGGVGLGLMALLRHDLVLVMAGRRSSLAASVLLMFCGIWMITLGPHGLMLLIIARGRERSLVPLLVVEMVLNAGLTFLLIHVLGPTGAAWATLITLMVSSVVFLPLIVRRELAVHVARLIVVDGLVSVAAGLGVALLGWLAVSWIAPASGRIVAGGAITAAVGTAAGAVLLGARGRQQLTQLLRRRSEPRGLQVPR